MRYFAVLMLATLFLPGLAYGAEASFQMVVLAGERTSPEAEAEMQKVMKAKQERFQKCFTDLAQQHPELSFNTSRFLWLGVVDGKVSATSHESDDQLSDTNLVCLIDAAARLKPPKTASGDFVAEFRFKNQVATKPRVTETVSTLGKARFQKGKGAEKAFLREIDARMVDVAAQDRWEDCLRKHRQGSFRGTLTLRIYVSAYGEAKPQLDLHDYVYPLSTEAWTCFKEQVDASIGERLPVSKTGKYVAELDIKFRYQKGRTLPQRSLIAGVDRVHDVSFSLGNLKNPIDFAKQLRVYDGDEHYRITAVSNACRNFSKNENSRTQRHELRGLCFAMPTCDHKSKDSQVLWKRIQSELKATAASEAQCKAKAKECKAAFRAFKKRCGKLIESE